MNVGIEAPRNAASLAWRKSSYTANNGNCVEVCRLPNGDLAVRDSKRTDRGHTTASSAAWQTFVTAVAENRTR